MPFETWVEPTLARKRRIRVTRIAVVSVLAVVAVGVLVLCGGFGVHRMKQLNQALQPQPTPSATIPSGTAAPPAVVNALRDRLVPAPTGATPVPSSGGDSGVFNLIQFARIGFDDVPVAASVLDNEEFQVMVERAWRTANGTRTDVRLAEFRTAADADAFVLDQQRRYAGDLDVAATFGVSGVIRGAGYERGTRDTDGTRLTVLLGRVDNVVIAELVHTSGALDRTAAVSVLRRQAVALAKNR